MRVICTWLRVSPVIGSTCLNCDWLYTCLTCDWLYVSHMWMVHVGFCELHVRSYGWTFFVLICHFCLSVLTGYCVYHILLVCKCTCLTCDWQYLTQLWMVHVGFCELHVWSDGCSQQNRGRRTGQRNKNHSTGELDICAPVANFL